MKDGKFLTMGIETSCDETAIAILADGRTVLSNVISSQIDIFKNYGGVVPEIASRHHLENINGVLDQSLEEAGVTLDDIDLIGVTHGPGLVGALLMGVSTAKALAFAKDLPLVGVHHLMSHISANFIEYPELEPPFELGGLYEKIRAKTKRQEIYCISCSNPSNTGALKNSPNVISRPSQSFFTRLTETSLRRGSSILYTLEGVTPLRLASSLVFMLRSFIIS